jgi:hypothetical protein
MRMPKVFFAVPIFCIFSCGETNQNLVDSAVLVGDSVSVRLGMVSNTGQRMGGGSGEGMGLLKGNSVSVKVVVSGCKSGFSKTIDTFTPIDQLSIKFYKNDMDCRIKLTAVRLKAAGSTSSADYQLAAGSADSAYAIAGSSPSTQAKVYSATSGSTRKLLVNDALFDLKSNTSPDFKFQAIDGDVSTRSVQSVTQTQSLGTSALEAPNFEIPFDSKFPESANNGVSLSGTGAVYAAGTAGSAEANGGFQIDVLMRCANNVSLGNAGAVNATAACPTPAGDQMKVNDLQMAVVMCRSSDDRLTYQQAAALFAAVPSSRVMNSPTSFVPVIKSGSAFNSTSTADYITGLRFKGVKTHFPTAAISGTGISKGCTFNQSEQSKGWMIVRKSEGTGSSAATSYLVTNLELSAASSAAMIATAMKEEVRIFSSTGALESFKIPDGVSSISIKAWGAGGCVFDETPNYAASHNAEYGGAGGFSAATVSVKAGETVYVEVGQGARRYGSGSGGYPNGGDGYNGGCAGGGSSNVYIDGYGKPDKLVLVAGGGGGAGWYTPAGAQKQGNGAAGGGVIAQDGGANAGSGGSQTSGGQTGNGKGAALQGGASSGNGGTGGPGGGGGGYFGGASGVGGFGNTNGGGGGGSCYVGPAANGGALASNAGSKGINDYVDPAGSVRKLGERSFSAAECMSGTGKMPPKTTDADYLAGVATGGAIADAVQVPGWSANHKTAKGGDGRVVIRYSVPVAQIGSQSAVLDLKSDKNLVLALPLTDGGSGTLSLKDLSGNPKSITSGSTWGSAPLWKSGVGKFYGGAAHFNGSSYLNVAGSPDFNFGTGDFTIESWVNFQSGSNPYPTGPWEVLINVGGGYYGDGGVWFALVRNSSGGATFYIANVSGYAAIGTVSDLKVGKWRHLAVSKEGSNVRFFVDGEYIGQRVDSSAYGGNLAGYIALEHWANQHTQGYYFPFAYMQDIKIYKGIAKYTKNFTPDENSLVSQSSGANTAVSAQSEDFYKDSAGRILILSAATAGKDPRTLTKTTGKVLSGTDSCIDDVRWQKFIELAKTQNYRVTATLDGGTKPVTKASDWNLKKMINANQVKLKASLTDWHQIPYSYPLYVLAWDETSGATVTGGDYSLWSWGGTSYYFGYYGQSSNSFFDQTTYSNQTANWWILPPGVPDFP